MNLRAVVLSFIIIPAATAGEARGRAEVLDGDSLRIGTLAIRLHGIDAPERPQTCEIEGRAWACGRAATQALAEMLRHATVRCTWTERDAYGRAIATCFKDGMNVNAKLVAHGMALAYRQYSDRYVAQEAFARSQANGLWRSKFIAPWTWRRANSTPARRH